VHSDAFLISRRLLVRSAVTVNFLL